MTASVPAVRVDETLNGGHVSALLAAHVAALAPWVRAQRWFGDKGRSPSGWALRDAMPVPVDGAWFVPAVVAISFADEGGDARYFLPLAVVPAAGVAPLLHVDARNGRLAVVDAFALPAFGRWFLDQFSLGEGSGRGGRFRWEALPALAARLPAARAAAPQATAAEQSNTSLRYDDAVFLKVFRRLRSGINPDEEIGRFLTERTAYRRLPIPLGSVSYAEPDGSRSTAALVQSYVPSLGDGWSFTLDRLRRDDSWTDVQAERLLGERTGQLHLALASVPSDPDFGPEPIAPEAARDWERAAVAALRSTADDLSRRAPELPDRMRARVAAFGRRLPELERRAAGFRALPETLRTRVHGDYHLGQVLRTLDGDWVVLDFEGEPARGLDERRARTSPLKDVAGMLRSFGYARGAALRAEGPGGGPALEERLRRWEAEARAAFLAGYRTEVREQPRLVPADDGAFAAAVGAWELDKALYEIAYELGNRPDWLDLPLDALLDSDGFEEAGAG